MGRPSGKTDVTCDRRAMKTDAGRQTDQAKMFLIGSLSQLSARSPLCRRVVSSCFNHHACCPTAPLPGLSYHKI
ncbi:MAG TPA: hypothetical protein V6D20_06315 [Candidatus Obscuribacterales bacterium]